MKTIRPAVDLYTFYELNEKAQDKAINRLIDAWIQCEALIWEDALPSFKKAVAEAERMDTPWFLKEIIFDYCKEYVYQELDSWYFTKDGKEYGLIELVQEAYDNV